MRGFGVGALWVLGACGGPAAGAQAHEVVICPAGSVLDPGKQQCVAMEGAKPVATETEGTSATTSTSTSTSTSTMAVASTTTPPPPPTTGFAVDVRCNFTQGWVALMPASKYPKDDQFLMQALIGFTTDPSFWSTPEYRAIQPFAAKRCNATSATRLLAPAAGDYYLLAGQEGTFSLRGKYDKNGVRRKMTVNATTAVTLAPADLTYTWVCISCPWIVFRGEGGRDLAPFVVLANRRGRERRGTDLHEVAHVPVVDGRVMLRVVEIENEETHLDALVLRAAGQRLVPDPRSALARDDGAELRLGPRTQSTVTYVVPGVRDGFVDVELEATGYYDPL